MYLDPSDARKTATPCKKVDRARELMEMANQRAAGLGHVPSMGHPS
jgi:hypothetical protein